MVEKLITFIETTFWQPNFKPKTREYPLRMDNIFITTTENLNYMFFNNSIAKSIKLARSDKIESVVIKTL